MSLKYEPSLEPPHIYVKKLFLNRELYPEQARSERRATGAAAGGAVGAHTTPLRQQKTPLRQKTTPLSQQSTILRQQTTSLHQQMTPLCQQASSSRRAARAAAGRAVGTSTTPLYQQMTPLCHHVSR